MNLFVRWQHNCAKNWLTARDWPNRHFANEKKIATKQIVCFYGAKMWTSTSETTTYRPSYFSTLPRYLHPVQFPIIETRRTVSHIIKKWALNTRERSEKGPNTSILIFCGRANVCERKSQKRENSSIPPPRVGRHSVALGVDGDGEVRGWLRITVRKLLYTSCANGKFTACAPVAVTIVKNTIRLGRLFWLAFLPGLERTSGQFCSFTFNNTLTFDPVFR